MAIVREVRAEELDQLLELYSHLHETDAPSPPRRELAAIWGTILDSPRLRYFGVEHEGRLVATCHLVIVPNLTRGGRPYGVMENVVTHRDYRRRGFGRAVVGRALRCAWDEGCYKVMLQTGRLTEAVFHFYESVGFTREGKEAFIAWASE